MVKRGLAMLLAAVLALGLAACGSTDGENSGTAATTTTAENTTEATTTTEAPTTTTEAPADYTFEDGVFTVDQLRLSVPEDWVLASDAGVYMFTPADYPAHTDNLNIQVEPQTEGFEEITQEYMESILTAVYPDLVFIGFENGEKDGIPCIEMAYAASVGDVAMMAMQYLYNADQLYTITYTIVGEELMADMEASSETIEILE